MLHLIFFAIFIVGATIPQLPATLGLSGTQFLTIVFLNLALDIYGHSYQVSNRPLAQTPYVVSIQWNHYHFCTGSIYDRWTVLTSAGCVK
jgi:Trypsin